MDVKNSELFRFFSQFWGFVKEFYVPEGTDEYWEKFHFVGVNLMDQYSYDPKMHKLAIAVIMAFADYQDARVKELRNASNKENV